MCFTRSLPFSRHEIFAPAGSSQDIQPSVTSIRLMAAADGGAQEEHGHPDRQFPTCAQAELALRADSGLAGFISWRAQ